MSEIRIGHDQISLPVLSMWLEKGGIQVIAQGYPDWEKTKKLTGSQPLVLIGDDGKIVGTWHADLTETFREARASGRRNGRDSLTMNQEFVFESITIR